jgi:hypothetical protein
VKVDVAKLVELTTQATPEAARSGAPTNLTEPKGAVGRYSGAHRKTGPPRSEAGETLGHNLKGDA